MRSVPRSALWWPQGLIVAFLLAMLVTLGIVGSLFGPPGARPSGIIYGQVVLREGNCMPIVVPYLCSISLVSRTIYIREPAMREMMEGFYLRVRPPLVAATEARHGFFEISLPVGLYSVFVEDARGEYCNSFTGRGLMCGVLVSQGAAVQYNITINHASD